MDIRLEWYGTSTFRLTIAETVIFLDAYLDRVPEAPPVGLRSAEVDRADFVLIGHSHFDHLMGAETIAMNTGATIVGSYETVRIMSELGVPERQLLAVSGGEPVQLADHVRTRVFPSLHSCKWASASRVDTDECCTGGEGLSHQDRLATTARLGAGSGTTLAASTWFPTPARGDGGALAFLVQTPDGSIWWNDTSGYWTGIGRDVHPDVAILAAAGRGNIDGEPIQGSIAQFVTGQARLLGPKRVLFCHHDDWMPPITRGDLDTGPMRRELKEHCSAVDVMEPGYDDPCPILAGL